MRQIYAKIHALGPKGSLDTAELGVYYDYLAKAYWNEAEAYGQLTIAVDTVGEIPFEMILERYDVEEDTIDFHLQETHPFSRNGKYKASYFNSYLMTISHEDTTNHYLEMLHGQPYSLLEARDSSNLWRPVSFSERYAWCGNSFAEIALKPDWQFQFLILKQEGTYKTRLRFKVRNFNHVYYSNEFEGFVNYSQFDQSDLYQDAKLLSFVWENDSSKAKVNHLMDQYLLDR